MGLIKNKGRLIKTIRVMNYSDFTTKAGEKDMFASALFVSKKFKKYCYTLELCFIKLFGHA